jgi:hypothetical protein
MAPSDWYRFLNGFVFLWANEDRLNRHLRAFEGRRQVVLIFDAKRLLADLGHPSLFEPDQQRQRPPQCRGALSDAFHLLPRLAQQGLAHHRIRAAATFELSG